MAKVLDVPLEEYVFCEAAGNSATLSNLAPTADPTKVRGSSNTTFKVANRYGLQPYVYAISCFGDTADIVDWSLYEKGALVGRSHNFNYAADGEGAVGGNKTKYLPCPIALTIGDELEVQWAEDASTNVEPTVILHVSYGGVPMVGNPMFQSQVMCIQKGLAKPGKVWYLTLDQTATTAATWTDNGQTINQHNHNSQYLNAEKKYIAVAGMAGTGGASWKAWRLKFPGVDTRCGGYGILDCALDDSDWWPLMIEFDGDEEVSLETFDVDGSLTPTVNICLVEV